MGKIEVAFWTSLVIQWLVNGFLMYVVFTMKQDQHIKKMMNRQTQDKTDERLKRLEDEQKRLGKSFLPVYKAREEVRVLSQRVESMADELEEKSKGIEDVGELLTDFAGTLGQLALVKNKAEQMGNGHKPHPPEPEDTPIHHEPDPIQETPSVSEGPEQEGPIEEPVIAVRRAHRAVPLKDFETESDDSPISSVAKKFTND